MKIQFFLFLFTLVSIIQARAQHRGCVSIYEHTLCESENEYTLNSDPIKWSFSKKEFQQKIIQIVQENLNLSGPLVLDVFLWVNDYNTIQVIKVQGWHRDKKFLLTLPLDLALWENRESSTIRRMLDMPYPLDFGIQLGELIVICKGRCEAKHFEILNQIPDIKITSVTDEILMIRFQPWLELDYLVQIKGLGDYSTYFSNTEISQVLEANGFSQLGFRFSISL